MFKSLKTKPYDNRILPIETVTAYKTNSNETLYQLKRIEKEEIDDYEIEYETVYESIDIIDKRGNLIRTMVQPVKRSKVINKTNKKITPSFYTCKFCGASLNENQSKCNYCLSYIKWN